MKYIIVLGDGMSDEPLEQLGGKTPLMAANKPNIDKIAHLGQTGLLRTVPPTMHPGSEIANMAIMGYDVEKVFEGRGSLEAASMGVTLEPGDMAMRVNLISIEDEKIKNHSAGHISDEEAKELILYLQDHLGTDRVTFYPGVSYRHLLVIKGGNKEIACTPPHDVPGTPWRDVMPKEKSKAGEATAALVEDLIVKSQQLLKDHPVNKAREEKGKDPANSIWPWSPGYKPEMKTFQESYGIKTGAVISAVDLIFGIGAYAGLDPIHVEGATGLYDTNYEGKVEAAIDALKEKDFVYLHIEASDEAGHEGDYKLKTKTIEYLDSRVVKPLWEAVQKMDENVTIAILPDHPTPCALKTHTHEPVPVIIYRKGIVADAVSRYDEDSVRSGSLGLMVGPELMESLFDHE